MEDSPKIKLGMRELAENRRRREEITERERQRRLRQREIEEMHVMHARRHERLMAEYNELYKPDRQIEELVNKNIKLQDKLRKDQDNWLDTIGYSLFNISPYHQRFGQKHYSQQYHPTLQQQIDAAKRGKNYQWPIANKAWCNKHSACFGPFKREMARAIFETHFHPGILEAMGPRYFDKYKGEGEFIPEIRRARMSRKIAYDEDTDKHNFVKLGPEHFEFNSKKRKPKKPKKSKSKKPKKSKSKRPKKHSKKHSKKSKSKRPKKHSKKHSKKSKRV